MIVCVHIQYYCLCANSFSFLFYSSGRSSEENENYVDMENPCGVTPSKPRPLTPSQPQPLTPSQPQPLTPSSLGPNDNEDSPGNQATNEANVEESQDTAKPTPNPRRTPSTREWVKPSPTPRTSRIEGTCTALEEEVTAIEKRAEEDCGTTQTVCKDGPSDDGENGSPWNQAQDLPLEHLSVSPTSLIAGVTLSSPPITPRRTGKTLDKIREKIRKEKAKKEAEMTPATQQSNDNPSNIVTESPPPVANSAQVKLPPKTMPKPTKKPRAIPALSKMDPKSDSVSTSDSTNRYTPSPVTPTAKCLMSPSSSAPEDTQPSLVQRQSSGEEYLPTDDDNLSETEHSSERELSPPPAVPVRTKNYHEVVLPSEHTQGGLTIAKKNNSSPGALSCQKELSPPVEAKTDAPSLERKARNKRRFYERWKPGKAQKEASNKKGGREAKPEGSPLRSDISKKRDTKKPSDPLKLKKSHSTCDSKSKPYLQRVTSDPSRKTPLPQLPSGIVPKPTFMNMKRRPLPQEPFMDNDDSYLYSSGEPRDYDLIDYFPPANSLPRNFQPVTLSALQGDHFQRRQPRPSSPNIDFDYVNEDEFPRPSHSVPTTHPLSRQSFPEPSHSPSSPCPPPTLAQQTPRPLFQPFSFAEPKQYHSTRRGSDLSPEYDYPQIHGILPPGNLPPVSHARKPHSSHPAASLLLSPVTGMNMRKSHSTDFDHENDQYVEMTGMGMAGIRCREKLPDDDDYQNWEVIKSISAKRSQSMEDIQLYKNIPISPGSHQLPMSIMNQPASIPLPFRQMQQPFFLPPRNIPRTSQDMSSTPGLQLSPPHQSPVVMHMPQQSLPATFQPTFLPARSGSPFLHNQSYLPKSLVTPGQGLRRSDEMLCSAVQSHVHSPHNSPRAFPHIAHDTGQELSLSNIKQGPIPQTVTSSVGTSTWTSENDPAANYYNVVSKSHFRQPPPTSVSLPQNNAYLDVISD